MEDPIFIPIEQLEQDKEGFSQIVMDMVAGKTGSLRVEQARKGRGKVSTVNTVTLQ